MGSDGGFPFKVGRRCEHEGWLLSLMCLWRGRELGEEEEGAVNGGATGCIPWG